jgi:hypothetical protein
MLFCFGIVFYQEIHWITPGTFLNSPGCTTVSGLYDKARYKEQRAWDDQDNAGSFTMIHHNADKKIFIFYYDDTH